MTTSSINPTATAGQLANAYTASAQSVITTQTKSAQTMSTALSKLQSALSAFNNALTGLSTGKTMVANTASFSSTGFATASVASSAQAGIFSLFVAACNISPISASAIATIGSAIVSS